MKATPKPQDPQQKIRELQRRIRQHDHLYYNLDRPEIPDAEYDQLFNELLEIEQSHPRLVEPNSPTQRVGGTVAAGFATVTHGEPMLSLANAFSAEDFAAWHARCTRGLEPEQFTITAELKFDGLALSLTYRDGHLTQAATRGNGQTGEDVTHTVRTIRNVPLVLPGHAPGDTFVRGEAYMPVPAFQELNEERVKQGEYSYANPRNAAAGAMRQLDPSQTAKRDLRFWAYTLQYADHGAYDSHWENLDLMSKMGLPVSHRRVHRSTVGEIIEYYEEMLRLRPSLPFEADGIVIKVDERHHQLELGATGHDPRWATAWKFPAQRATTRLKDIFISMGRYGKLTPVADLEPVSLDGTTIQHASLHNEEDVLRKDIRAGDEVVIERAGGVIPQVIGPVNTDPNRETTPFRMPEQCPECGQSVQHFPQDAAHWCANDDCGSKPVEALKHFVSKDALDVEGMGPVICQNLVDSELVANPGDIFRLTVEQLASLNRMGTKSARRIHDNIQGARNRPLDRVLYALGIYRLGHHVSHQLADMCRSMDEVASLSREQLMNMEGISDKIADSVTAGFASQRTRDIINTMRDAGVALHTMEEEKPMSQNIKPLFDGMRICVTGTLSLMSRNQAQGYISALQGTADSNVTKKTDVLVVGKKPGSKVAKAEKNGTEIWDEEKFVSKLAEAGMIV